ncbi:hypothetical protein GOBAR_DD00899 [Gossypium barbadense]|nr:hypothetical protein GOBAR_DD00899 [Gossypium barbadense]
MKAIKALDLVPRQPISRRMVPLVLFASTLAASLISVPNLDGVITQNGNLGSYSSSFPYISIVILFFPSQGLYLNKKLSLDLRIGGVKDKPSTMDKKKRRIGTPVWKPVCTQASSLEAAMGALYFLAVGWLEPVVKDVGVESEIGSQMQEVNESTIEVMDATVTPKAFEDDIEDEASKENPVLSAAKHSLSVEVGASVIRFVRGKDGSTKEKIEKETGVQIILPSSKQEDAIIIEGTSAVSVAKASKEIQHIINEAVKTPSLDYSHFVSLPLAIHPELVAKLVNFQNSILGISDANAGENLEGNSDGDGYEGDAQDEQLDKGSAVAVERKVANDRESVKVDVRGIPLVSYAPKEPKDSKSSSLSGKRTIWFFDASLSPKIPFRHIRTLYHSKHFPLIALTNLADLWNKERVNLATEVLKSISPKVMDALDNRPLFVRLKGLDCMRGSLDKACVVYAPVEEIGSENRLSRACQVIIDAFVEAGLVLERDIRHELKLRLLSGKEIDQKKGKRSYLEVKYMLVCLDGDGYEGDAQDEQLDKGSAVAVERKVANDRESVKVDVRGIPLVSYAPKEPKDSKSSSLSGKRTIWFFDASLSPKIPFRHIRTLYLHATVMNAKHRKRRGNRKVKSDFFNACGIFKQFGSEEWGEYLIREAHLSQRFKYDENVTPNIRKVRGVLQSHGVGCTSVGVACPNKSVLKREGQDPQLTSQVTVTRRKNRKVKSDFFNACGIFKQFGSEEWGEYLIREAHLSQRFKYDENGYYHCCASIPFPENMQVD